MVFPIYCPTKGRWKTGKTLPLLAADQLPFFAVVEPQEATAYVDSLGREDRVLVLPENDQGLAYARQWILNHARQQNQDWFWMLDDDISRFSRVHNGKCVLASPREVLLAAQDVFAFQPDAALAALEYAQFAWSARKPWKLNSYCDVAVCVHAQRAQGLLFRAEVTLKVDRDFALQVLAAGWNTIRATWCAFECPKNGSNSGGLQPEYATVGREAMASRRMCELWPPEICTFKTKPDGRPDVKINWGYFKPKDAS